MSSNPDLQTVLEKTRRQEEGYEWFEAAKSYEELISSKQGVSFSSAEVWERLAFCYSQASRQAKDREQFTRLRQAASAYKTAARLFEEEGKLESGGRSAECNALAEYVSSWVASSASERKNLLERCCSFGHKGLEAYEKSGNGLRFGKLCTEMVLSLLERLYVASDCTEMSSIASEGIESANKAIAVLSKIGDKSELLRAHYVAGLLTWYTANFCEQEERAQKELVQRSIDHSEKALELSKEVNNLYHGAMSNWVAAFCDLAFTEKAESARDHSNRMLEQGIIVRDNFLIGIALYLLAFFTDWMTLREADPDKKKDGHKKIIRYCEESISYLALVSQDYFIAETYLFYAESYSSLASWEVNLDDKRAILRKAVEIGRKGLEHANDSGSPEALFSTLHALSKALHFNSNIATERNEKAKLLEEALEKRIEFNKTIERAFPSNAWFLGVGKNYEGLIKADLARAEKDRVRRMSLLRDAVSDAEDSLLHCRKWIQSRPIPAHMAAVAGFEDSFVGISNELYMLTEDKLILARAIEVCEDAASHFKAVDLPSRAAEAYWKIASNQDLLLAHEKAAGNFEKAFVEYRAAAERIPHFADFYLDHALYMEAWGEIERARFEHERERYADTIEHYEKAAGLLKSSKRWRYLSSNFLAWSLLEKAEDSSRKEVISQSMEYFKQAAELFEEAREALEEEICKIQNLDEKNKTTKLCEASIIRKDYCLARLDVEDARKNDLEGNYLQSAEKYGMAASIFERILKKTDMEDYRREIRPIAYMCHAWQKMKLADGSVSPELYLEASQLFIEAKEYGAKDRTRLLASGNGAFCKALEHGTRFEATHEKDEFTKAKHYLGTAADYYMKAAFDSAFVWASAAETLLDAYSHMTRAEVEINPESKMKEYLFAEKCLERSAKLYETAGHIGKKDEVLRILKEVHEKREFASSLRELLTAPSDASATSVISTPASRVEEPVGLLKFEHEFIHVNLIAHRKEIAVGEDWDLDVQMANLGKNVALLSRVEHLVPEEFDLVREPKIFHVVNGNLDMRGRSLEPLKTEEFTVGLRSFVKGAFSVKPRIVYLREDGQEMFCEPEPVTVNVSRLILPGHIATGYEDLDNMLLGGIPQSYAVILSSPSFDERDLMVRCFLETGAKNGEITYYVTIDASQTKTLIEEYQSNFFLFLCNPRADEIIKSLPNVFKLKGIENLTEISIALTSAFRRIDASSAVPRRACIEIISDVLLQHHAVSIRRWLAALIPEFRSRGFTTLAIINPQMHPLEETQAILDLFDGEIDIFERETAKGLEKFLKIRKMHSQRYIDRESPLKIDRIRH